MGRERGATKGGCFYYLFFLLMVGREKKYQNSDSIPAQINVCSIPASRGRLGQADLKGQGEERRGEGGERRRQKKRQRRWGGCPGRKGWVPEKPAVREEAGRQENERHRDPPPGWQETLGCGQGVE